MTPNISNQIRWTVTDLEGFPNNGNRYEIIDGELFVTETASQSQKSKVKSQKNQLWRRNWFQAPKCELWNKAERFYSETRSARHKGYLLQAPNFSYGDSYF